MAIRLSRGRWLLPAVICAGAWAQTFTISTYTGDGGAPGYNDSGLLDSLYNSPSMVAITSSGKMYVADPLNHRIRLVSGGTVTTVAGTGTAGTSDDGTAATSADLRAPEGVALDSKGLLYIADTGNHCIRQVDASGNIWTIAGVCGSEGKTGDNSTATDALLSYPSYIMFDSWGNLFIADTGNSEIRKVAGTTITCALGCGSTSGTINHPRSVAVDTNGTLYIADTGDYQVVKYANGTLTVLAGTGKLGFSGDGGPATSALLNNPEAVALDPAGNVYIADSFNSRIRKILPNGNIVTVAGNGVMTYAGDGGAATSASLYFPRGLLVDGTGNVYVADTGNACIRLLTASYPTISASGVTNAASGSTTISPGSLATLYGTYFSTSTVSGSAPYGTTLGNVSVKVNGVAAPLLYVSPTQINFQVPWATQAGTGTVAVVQNGGAGKSVSVTVATAAPGLFLTSAGAVVAQNYPSYTQNTSSNPIATGGLIIAYLTGVGPVSPTVSDGVATPSDQYYSATASCSATIGGSTAIVSFAGLVPTLVGVAQVNVTVPASAKSGANALVVTCNGVASNSANIYVK